jgi:GMP synthase-like glutamine amidotransferase
VAARCFRSDESDESVIKRIGLLMCGHVDPKSSHIAGDYPDLYRALLRDQPLELIRYDLDEGRFPDSERECDGWICSPSRSSVYDDLPWIPDAAALHQRVIASEVPYVGICFGHQLLAQSLGVEVQRAEHGWNVGVHEYDIVTPQRWMVGDHSNVRLIASHQDQVMSLPGEATLLFRAADGSCPIAGMAIGDRAWTIQLHPEFVPELADHLLAGRVALIGSEKVAAARATLTQPLSQRRVAEWIGRFFSPA